MAASYTDNPSNMPDIIQYIILDKSRCVQEIIMAEKCFFYDTCAFRRHANLQHPEPLFEFLKGKNGIVVITRTIIMELASASKSLNVEYIEYLKKMHQAGLKVLVVYEEIIFDVLKQCFTSNAQINKFLNIAINVAKSTTGTISSLYKSEIQLRTDIMTDGNTDSTLFVQFFNTVRGNKESGDNLGEEMIAICIHMLSNIPEPYNYKYIVMTEDKGAIRLINKIRKNLCDHIAKNTVTAVTTVVLGQKIYQENLIVTKDEVEEFVSAGITGGMVTIVASEEYDLEPQEKVLLFSEVADRIMTPNAIRIYY